MDKESFDNFFKVHSQNVDNADSLGFWKLTDRILEQYLLDSMPNRIGKKIADFGGGTGRWLLKLDPYFSNSEFNLVDLSLDMLNQAKRKVEDGMYRNNIRTIHSDISNIADLDEGSIDYVISTYNPISFCDKPESVISEAFRVLKPGGCAMITVQGYMNALYSKINNYLANSKELNSIYRDKKVKWADNVPPLWQLSKEDMEQLFSSSGFKRINSRGIACLVQPQPEDFDPENKTLGPLSKKLNEDSTFFQTVLDMEVEIGKRSSAVNRGMNILTIGSK